MTKKELIDLLYHYDDATEIRVNDYFSNEPKWSLSRYIEYLNGKILLNLR